VAWANADVTVRADRAPAASRDLMAMRLEIMVSLNLMY
jgi:hypothetical protein